MKANLNSHVVENAENGFINREISWIDFNYRVLDCAQNKDIPLNERFKFLAITCSNLTEFISVRFANAFTNRNEEPYSEILEKMKGFYNKQTKVYDSLKEEIKKKGINITKVSKLDKKSLRKLYNIFIKNIFPLLTPISIDTYADSSNLYSGQTCVACIIKQGDMEILNIIPIVKQIQSVYILGNNVVIIEDIIETFLNSLFINKNVVEYGVFRIIKDASVILDHDSDKFIIDRMNDTIIRRKMADTIFLETDGKTTKRLKNILMEVFNVPKSHQYQKGSLIDYTRYMSTQLLPDEYSYKHFDTVPLKSGNSYSLFDMISDNDILLHHPYDSYDTVVKFIQHAAIDPDVIGIKQTLYRVSSIDSPIVEALCKASQNGKSVSVLVEIKARFDEENNIRVIEKLKTYGCNVLLGDEFLKTHCKMCIVARREDGDIKMYSHVSTGNYNEKTSKVYTDLSYFTSKQKIGTDLLNVFNILSGISDPNEKLQKIAYSPVTLRKTLIKCIDREIDNAKKGKDSEIFLKLNSLSDHIMVNKLYEAAEKGVRIYIICRGVCSILPHKNIYIKSIVGRFLEHSRIYYFKNDKSPEYYISSADLLTRNLDKRVEIMISLKESIVIKKIVEVIKVFKEDTDNSFEMNVNGKFIKMKGKFNSHEWFITASKKNLKLSTKSKKK